MAACAPAWAAIFFEIHRNAEKERGEGTRRKIVDSGLWIMARRSDIFIFFPNDH